MTDPDEPGVVDQGAVERVTAWVSERFPAAKVPATSAETCIYTNTHDERFVLERHGSVVVASPCSGHGFKFASVIGERVAHLVVD